MTQRTQLPTTKQVLDETQRRRMANAAQKTQLPTTKELTTCTQEPTNTHFLPGLDPLDPSTTPPLTELLKEHKASVDELAMPFNIYESHLANATPEAVRWLWDKRLPLASITLLDGDHGCGKSLLALQIAACVSSGSPLPDGTPTIQGGVVIISPHTDATTTQLQLLTTWGADLSRIEILSYIQDPENSSHSSGYRPFSLPEDFPRLFEAVERVNARLIIFDPFISLLSRNFRYTNERLGHLLADLKQHLIERNVACLLVRNCPAKGGHARPSVLERSDHFVTIATCRLILAPDPMQPDRLLLAHAKSIHPTLTPTLILQIQSLPANPAIPRITVQGSHCLHARDFIECRPDILHRRLLSQHLLRIIVGAKTPIAVSTLYTLSPHSSPFQIQRSLNDLLRMGQIERPVRGFYAPAPATPVFPLQGTAATTSSPPPVNNLKPTAATIPIPPPVNNLKPTAATTPIPPPVNNFKPTAATTPTSPSVNNLKPTAATTPTPPPVNNFDSTAATELALV